LKNGLKAQLRNYVHLSDDKDSAKIVGLRHSSDIVVLEINTTDFLKDNFKIYDAKNGIYLAKEISSKYIIISE
jgi:putative RNA 2'-phosphotransferase